MREMDECECGDDGHYYYSLHSWPEKIEAVISPLKESISPDDAFDWEKISLDRYKEQTNEIVESFKKEQNEIGDEDGEIEKNIQIILFGYKQLEDMIKRSYDEGKEKFKFVGVFMLGTRRHSHEDPLRMNEILTSLIMCPHDTKK
jgi:hypothetical protein